MKAPPFAYARAESLDHALELLAEAGGEGKPIAGGQSLVPLLVHRIVRPTHLVDIDGVGELEGVGRDEHGLRLGALTRHAAVEHGAFEGRERVLSLAAAHIGHVPIRSRGSLGGSVAHADPAAELPLALLALDAEVVVKSAASEQAIPIDGFLLGPFTSALGPGDVVTAVTVPGRMRAGSAAFAEVASRAGDFALAAVAATALLDDGRLGDVRIALGAVEARPVRARGAEALLEGAVPSNAAIAAAARAAARECEPVEDRATSGPYRRALVERLVRDTLTRLLEPE